MEARSVNWYILSTLVIASVFFLNVVGILTVVLFNISNSSFFISVFPAVKDLVIGIIFLVTIVGTAYSKRGLVLKHKEVALHLLAILLIAYLFFQLVSSSAPMVYRLYNFRQMIIFVLTLFIFRNLNFINHDLLFFKRVFINLTFFICLFGVFEYLMPSGFWTDTIGLEKYSASRFLGETDFNRLYSPDLYFLIGKVVRRMMSTFAEPTALGSYLSLAFSYLIFVPEKIPLKRVTLVLSLVCGILVFSKIFIASIFIILGYKWIIRSPKFWPLVLVTVAIYIASSYLYEAYGKIHGSFAHLFGYYTGINMLFEYPLGLGLGMAGNRGVEEYRSSFGEFGSESGLGSVLAQLGWIGMIFPLIVLVLMYQFKKEFRKTGIRDYLGLFVGGVVYMMNFYLSYASLGVSGNIMYFILFGIYLNPFVLSNNEKRWA